MNIITGSTGTNHVTSVDDGIIHQAIIEGSSPDLNAVYVLDIDNGLNVTISDEWEVTVDTGTGVFQGRYFNVPVAETVAVPSTSATTTYFLMVQYDINNNTGDESLSYKITPMTVIEADINRGGTQAQGLLASLFVVNGVLTSVTMEAKEVKKFRADVLTKTLSAGSTTLTFTSSLIKSDSLIDVYSDPAVNYTDITGTTNSVTITYEAQESDVSVKLVIH